ncbi:MAG: GNAT family N-acetyltransferase [Betaproteobacteria bacterium]|nr:GNAT family N-acetyltransferase [Betaproteobacteria bacterium]
MLRRLRAQDLARFHAYRSDSLVGRYQGWSPMDRDEALEFIHQVNAGPLFVGGQWSQVAVAMADSDELVGDIGLFVTENAEEGEIGFTLSPDATGKGYATRAVQEVIRLLFECTRVQRIIGVSDARNTPSVRVLERAGMTHVESRETRFKGEACTEWVYAIRR